MSMQEKLDIAISLAAQTAQNTQYIKQMLESQQRPAEPTREYVSYSTLDVMFSDICNGRKIEAIKCIRQLTGCGLKEAKDLVEKYF